jgi:hypothetical protein
MAAGRGPLRRQGGGKTLGRGVGLWRLGLGKGHGSDGLAAGPSAASPSGCAGTHNPPNNQSPRSCGELCRHRTYNPPRIAGGARARQFVRPRHATRRRSGHAGLETGRLSAYL